MASEEKMELILRDKLAIDRTHLANERTFLAYFRSFLVTMATGFTFLKIELFSDLYFLAISLLVLSPVLLVIGILRIFFTRRNINRLYIEKPSRQ